MMEQQTKLSKSSDVDGRGQRTRAGGSDVVSNSRKHKPQRPLKVLVIDDDRADYLLVEKYLSKSRDGECICTYIDNFDDGLDAVRSGKFDVALVDYLLGPQTGLDLIRKARGHLALMPIILLTGHGGLKTDLAAFDLGASEYLDKAELSPTTLGRVVRYACAHHKIERRLRASQRRMREAVHQAEVANAAKSAFLANMSHELRTPLNAIIGFSDVLLNGHIESLGTAKRQEYVKDIHDSGLHQLNVINDILDLSKIEAGQFDLDETDIDLPRLIECCVQTVMGWEKGAGRRIDQRIDIDLPLLHGDERRVKQVLLNLLTNAIKFTPQTGNILVEATTDAGGAIVLSVQDTGVGIAKRDLKKVMTPFGQGDNPHVRAQQGTGLGLPLTKALAESHGATLKLASRPGKGTTVTARFPVKRSVNRHRAAKRAAA